MAREPDPTRHLFCKAFLKAHRSCVYVLSVAAFALGTETLRPTHLWNFLSIPSLPEPLFGNSTAISSTERLGKEILRDVEGALTEDLLNTGTLDAFFRNLPSSGPRRPQPHSL